MTPNELIIAKQYQTEIDKLRVETAKLKKITKDAQRALANRVELEREAQKPGWWHWFLEICPNCGGQGQQPVRDDLGEDINLFEKVDGYNRDQRDGTTNFTCGCGAKMVAKYRHASQDWEVLEDEEGNALSKTPKKLFEDTRETFLDREDK